MNRRETLPTLLGLAVSSVSLCGLAQQAASRIARIGFLGSTSASSFATRVDVLRQGLRALGYIEHKNYEFEFRWADGVYERHAALAEELVRLKVDVIITVGTPPTLAAKRGTTTIPIVMVTVGDAVASGVVASLARPGANVTGGTFFLPELASKRLELLKETVPGAHQFAAFGYPDNPSHDVIFAALMAAATTLGVKLHRIDVRNAEGWDAAFAQATDRRIDGLIVIDDSFIFANVKTIADRAIARGLPSIGFTEYANAGGMLAYGIDRIDTFRRAAYFVDKILKGTKPSDIPVEQPTRFETVVNLKTAKTLGIRIPPPVMLRADKVIE